MNLFIVFGLLAVGAILALGGIAHLVTGIGGNAHRQLVRFYEEALVEMNEDHGSVRQPQASLVNQSDE